MSRYSSNYWFSSTATVLKQMHLTVLPLLFASLLGVGSSLKATGPRVRFISFRVSSINNKNCNDNKKGLSPYLSAVALITLPIFCSSIFPELYSQIVNESLLPRERKLYIFGALLAKRLYLDFVGWSTFHLASKRAAEDAWGDFGEVM
jgi:hypothetical protein